MPVISIVSGKGGSGKSLLGAVLGRALAREGERVLLVDMDIFVRGLTVLVSLSGFTKYERSSGATISDLLGIFAENSKDRGPRDDRPGVYSITRFFECDVLPAVDNIGAPLDYDDKSLSDEEFCDGCVSKMISNLRGKYDYIFLDNRAGMDSLVASSCKNANIILSVAEDDDVGRQTNANMVRFLQAKGYAKVVYTILNKGRNIRIYDDLKPRARTRSEYSVLGVIPFDIDVLEEFGTERFWFSVTETLYFRALLDVWNELSTIERVKQITLTKYRFPPKIYMRPSEGKYTLIERIMRLNSFMLIVFGAGFWLFDAFRKGAFTEVQSVAVISIVFGAVALALSTSSFMDFIRPRRTTERPHDT